MKIGFEIHQQLDTTKLFCGSESRLREEEAEYNVLRRLRPTQSELGAVDEAAMKEFLKGKGFVYKGYNDTICLVELDEEPPHDPNPAAIEIAMTIALLLNASVVDEIHFMRKLVIDGSNTSGFQRTAVIAFDGHIDTSEGRVRITTIALEEEAARKVEGDDLTTTYNLDRLGIPLVEVTTAPDIKSPAQARELALKLGELLRATGRVKRGIGTIRQDINVSIEGGARVEIKGVQELNLIQKIIETEVERQKGLIKIKDELENRRVSTSSIGKSGVEDVTDIFKNTDSKIIKNQIKNGRILAVKLDGFAGLLGGGLLGREIAGSVKVHSGLKGIFHSDELPSYGITEKEVSKVHKKLKTGEKDAFVLVSGKEEKTSKALEAVIGRAKLALKGPLEETRMAKETRTEYMRPLPGAARMYPETDILPYVISKEQLERLNNNLPETYKEKSERFTSLGINIEQARQLVRSSPAISSYFEEKASEISFSISGFASLLLTASSDVLNNRINFEDIKGLVNSIDEKKISIDAAPEVLNELKRGKTLKDVLEGRGGNIDLEALVDRVISEKTDFIREKGEFAFKPIMGLVMKEARGRVDGKEVNELLKKKIDEIISK